MLRSGWPDRTPCRVDNAGARLTGELIGRDGSDGDIARQDQSCLRALGAWPSKQQKWARPLSDRATELAAMLAFQKASMISAPLRVKSARSVFLSTFNLIARTLPSAKAALNTSSTWPSPA